MRNPHQRPPESVRLLFKWAQKSSSKDLSDSGKILDFTSQPENQQVELFRLDHFQSSNLNRLFNEFLNTSSCYQTLELPAEIPASPTVFELKALPGLLVIPSLLPLAVQSELLNKLVHRDLSAPTHKTNLHLHYHMSYKDVASSDRDDSNNSFFDVDPSIQLLPKDVSVHKPISIQQMLEKKLRWMTLGGQYDWSAKTYPVEQPPPFPADIGRLLGQLFPEVEAQAAIINFYSPGDTLSAHRDVSEECDRSLISISLGCDAIFILGNEDGSQTASIWLRSGDAVLMTGQSRYAWHAVPKILPNTCPEMLRNWPGPALGNSRHDHWKGWMANKRINLNIRQMKERLDNKPAIPATQGSP